MARVTADRAHADGGFRGNVQRPKHPEAARSQACAASLLVRQRITFVVTEVEHRSIVRDVRVDGRAGEANVAAVVDLAEEDAACRVRGETACRGCDRVDVGRGDGGGVERESLRRAAGAARRERDVVRVGVGP